MAEPFIGQISMFAGNFAPRGWAFCNGQLLAISTNTALFSILGTTYGGDGRVTFALPNLQGRVPMHSGTGPGLSPRTLGEVGGQETTSLTVAQLPAHSHSARANSGAANQVTPAGNVLATGSRPGYSTASANSDMGGTAIANTGGSQPHDNVQPFLALNYIIALEGIFPSRN